MLSLRRSFLRRYRLYAPLMWRRGWWFLLILLLCDGVTALCFPQIQASLSFNGPVHVQNVGVAPMSGQTMLANDTFQRDNQLYWGATPDHQSWQADAASAPNFHIVNNAGVVDGLSSHTFQNAVLGTVGTDLEMTFSGTLSHYAPNTGVLGAILRWQDANNFYQACLDGQDFILARTMDGMTISLKSISMPIQDGSPYTLRFRAVGSQLFAMVWPSDQPAPADWQISASDSALPGGQAGIRVLAPKNGQATITAFTEVAL